MPDNPEMPDEIWAGDEDWSTERDPCVKRDTRYIRLDVARVLITMREAEIERMNDELVVRRMPRDEIYEGLQNALASANAALSELDDALALIASQAAEIALINEWRKELEDQNRQLIADIERLRTALRAISRDSLAALGKE